MNTKINKLLTEIRHGMDEEEAFGPEGTEPTNAAQDAKAGDLEAGNPSTVDDDIIAYIDGIVASMLELYEMTEDEAYDFISEVAAAMADAGMLPETPEEDDPNAIKAEWLGTAKTIGFAAEVMSAAEEASSE
jgi:hypothetical protein